MENKYDQNFRFSCWFPYKKKTFCTKRLTTSEDVTVSWRSYKPVFGTEIPPTVPAGPWLVYKTLNSSLQFNGHKSPVLLFKLQTWWKGIIIFYSLWLETSFLFWVECNFFFSENGLSSILLFCNCWSALSINGKRYVQYSVTI